MQFCIYIHAGMQKKKKIVVKTENYQYMYVFIGPSVSTPHAHSKN